MQDARCWEQDIREAVPDAAEAKLIDRVAIAEEINDFKAASTVVL